MDLFTRIENWGRALSVAELAELTGLSKRTLHRQIAARKLPAIRIAGTLRLEPKATAEWLKTRFS